MKRNITQKLLQWKQAKDRKPLIVYGLRQVGKTYSITEFGAQHFPAMHYLNFEKDASLTKIFQQDLNPTRIIEEISFVLKRSIDINKDFVFFDEIQACPRALTSLKYFQEEMPQLALCSAGSLLGVYLPLDSFPVGKVDIMKIFPMSFTEFLQAIDEKQAVTFMQQLTATSVIPEVVHERLWQQMKLYFIVGGLPEAVKTFVAQQQYLPNALQAVRQKQAELMLAYNADMAKHAGKVNAMHLDRILKSIPAQLAKEQDGSASKFKFKGVLPGINRYERLAHAIDWLEAAGLILKTSIVNSGELPFAAYIKENAFKLYMADVGLLGALSGLSPATILQYNYGTYKGYFAENFVAQEFYCTGVDKLYSWQDNRAEVEFLREIDGAVIPIEVKSGWITKTQSLQTFANKYQTKLSIILSSNNLHIDPHTRVHRYPLYLASRVPL